MSKDEALLRRLLERASIRRFRDQMLPHDIVNELLRAGQRAPTTFQAYSLVIVDDREKRAKIVEACRQRFIMKAPLFILVCVDLRRFRKLLDHLGHDYHLKHGYGMYAKVFSIVDAVLAAQHVSTAALCYGLGTCFVGAIFYAMEEVAAAVGLPDGVVPLMGLCVGYPDESPPIRPRWPLEVITHRNGYRETREDEIEKYLRSAEQALRDEAYYKKYSRRDYGFRDHLVWKTKMSEWIKAHDEAVLAFMRKNGLTLG